MQFSEPGVIRALRPIQREAGISLRKRRAWYEGDPAPVLTPTPAPTPSGTGTPPVNNGGEPEKLTLTTAQLAARLDTEVNKALSRMFETLGVKDATEAQARLKAQADAEAAQLSELEKANKKAADLEAKLKDAETKAAVATRTALEKERDSAIRDALKEAKNPAKVLTLLLASHKADIAGVMADDGTLDAKKIGDLVTKAKKEYPEDFQSTNPGSQSHSGGRNPAPDDKRIETARKQIRVRY